MDLASFKTTFDGILEQYVTKKIDQSKHLIDDKHINKFIEYVNTFIFSGGKRIRPYGLMITYMGFGGQNEKAILNFGIIFELLHSMALIHDDIIDQSDKRHNAMTMHTYIQTLLNDNPQAKHVAEGQALLIGDLLLSRVYELRFKNHEFDEHLLFKARQNVHSMIEEVILGQMIDVDLTISGPAALSLIDKKNTYKTASYTFTRPMLTGAILAGADEEQQQLIQELGTYMGMAFQMRDDYLDIIGGDTTKNVFRDVQEGQQTYFSNYIFEKGSEEQKALLQSCMGKELTKEQIKDLQTMFAASGALDFGKTGVKNYSQKARSVLGKLQINDEAKASFLGLIGKMEKLQH